MKFLTALALSIMVVYILQGEPGVWYIALVWLVPLTLVVWYEVVSSDWTFYDKFINNQKGRHK